MRTAAAGPNSTAAIGREFSVVTDQEAAIRSGIKKSKMATNIVQIDCSLHFKWGVYT